MQELQSEEQQSVEKLEKLANIPLCTSVMYSDVGRGTPHITIFVLDHPAHHHRFVNCKQIN